MIPSFGAGFPLICVPHAGGSPAVFGPWKRYLPGVDVLGVTLPGRGARLREAPLRTWDAVLAQLRLPTDRDYAIYGHSLGALIAFEAARRAPRPPTHVFLGARRAPGVPDEAPMLSRLDGRAFLEAVDRRYGGVPEKLKESVSLQELFLPTLRADFALLDGWRYQTLPAMSVPFTVFRGTDDPRSPRWAMEPWALQTTGPFSLHDVSGGHFFHKETPASVCRVIERTLKA